MEVEERIVKIVIFMLRYLKENNAHWRKIKKTQMKPLKMKNAISDMTNTPHGIINKVDTVEKNY